VSLAWPVALGQLASMSMSVVDTMMVGRVSASAMASVSLGAWWGFAIVVFAFGMLRALDPIAAQAHGAGDHRAVSLALGHGVALSLVLSLPAAGLFFFAERGLALLGQPAELLPTAGAFARVFAAAAPGMLLFQAVRSVLQARGLMRPATIAIIAANVVNAAVDYTFVLGNFGAPALGAVGAALATVLSTWFQLGLLLWLTRRELAALWPGVREAFSLRPLARVARIGVPQGFQMASEVWSFLVAGFLVGTFGAADLAGHTIVMQLASLSFMVPLGVSTAAATRVGNLVGAGEPWTRPAIAAHLLGIGVMSVSALAFALLPGPLAALFTEDPAAVAVAVSLLPIAAAFQLFDGTQVIAFGVLRGAGDLTVPAAANIVGFWVLGLPIGAWLAFRHGLGSVGVWMGLVLGLATVALLLLVRERHTARRGGFRVGMAASEAPPRR
jgi:MATE family multidrug resistance protein